MRRVGGRLFIPAFYHYLALSSNDPGEKVGHKPGFHIRGDEPMTRRRKQAKRSKTRAPRRQTPIPGGRARLSPSVLHEIDDAITADATRHHVAKSFVQAVILAHHYGIKKQERY